MSNHDRDRIRTLQVNLIAKVGFLIWAVSIPFLYWLVHGPWGPLIRYPFILWGRDAMLHYFKARYVF
ncbi:MAG: hypothetical protein DMF68_19765 [Acidobacteria bacterium]|nr:MAG: hypothetical protein DMF68_19765 [Acidobacteriota bacterium]